MNCVELRHELLTTRYLFRYQILSPMVGIDIQHSRVANQDKTQRHMPPLVGGTCSYPSNAAGTPWPAPMLVGSSS